METLEDQLSARETLLIDRKKKFVQRESDFDRKTNDMMTDIDEGQHGITEYKNMRREKDNAVRFNYSTHIRIQEKSR